MSQIYDTIKGTFKDNRSGVFSDELITTLANQKLEEQRRSNLPVVPNKKPLLFRNRKAQIEKLKLENQQLQIKTTYPTNLRDTLKHTNSEPDAIIAFENQLQGILSVTEEKEYAKEDLDKTAELW